MSQPELSPKFKQVTVFAPASIGNVSVGFDLLGAAVTPIDGYKLGDTVVVTPLVLGQTVSELSQLDQLNNFRLINTGRFAKDLPEGLDHNLIYRCWQIFAKQSLQNGLPLLPMDVTLDKNMPIGSGLGSSACSVVAALVAYNQYHDNRFNSETLLMLMGEVEGSVSGSVHYDNVAPCYLGGVQLMVQYGETICQQLPHFDHWYWVMAYPGITVSTAQARSILPTSYTKTDLLAQNRYLANFIHACYTQQEKMAADMLVDRVAQPYRSQLLPNFDHCVAQCRELGAIACGISGSGPTLFSICNQQERAQTVAAWLQQHYLQNNDGFVHICKLSDGVVIDTILNEY